MFKHIRNLKKIWRNCLHLEDIVYQNQVGTLQSFNKQLIRNHFDNLSLTCKECGVTDEKYCHCNIIVSVTTHGRRIHNVHLTLESIMQQTMKPNKIVLGLDAEEFSQDNIPFSLKKYLQRGLEIQYSENIKSYKKLIPALKAFPNDIIITIDDDVIYPPNLIDILFLQHKENPSDIICTHAHIIKFAPTGELIPYAEWSDPPTDKSCASHSFLQLGIGGVLYPPHCLHTDVTDKSLFLKLSPTADDLWFKIMALKNGTFVRTAPIYDDFDNWITTTNKKGDIALFDTNINTNNQQFKKIMSYYDLTPHNFKDTME